MIKMLVLQFWTILGDLSFGEFQTVKIGNIFDFDILEEVLESQFQAIIQMQNFKCWQN